MLTLLAGAAAERLCTGGSVESKGYAADYRAAQAIAVSVGADGLLGRAEREAVALVCRHRGAIAAVAEALLRSDSLRLTGREVKSIAGTVRVPRLAGTTSGTGRPGVTAHARQVPPPA